MAKTVEEVKLEIRKTINVLTESFMKCKKGASS